MTRPDLPHSGSSADRASVGADVRSTVVSRLQQSNLFRRYQQAFEATTGLPLVLREPGSFRTPLQGSKRANPFCALMTQTNKTCAACLQLQQRVEANAALKPKTLQCYAGLSETAVPVRVGNQVLGYLQTGQVFFQMPSRKQFKAVARVIHGGDTGVDARKLAPAYFQTRIVTRKQYASIIRLLAIFAEHLAAVSNQMLAQAETTESPAITKVRGFIAEHQSELLRLSDAASAVNMSAYYFCKVFKQSTGVTFTEYLSRGRIEVVKDLLLNPYTRVGEAAYAAGFQSLSQFNRVFHRFAGEAPSRYRDRIHGLNGESPRLAVRVHAA
jgi:AraC-like DNA-binding protein/ligand-binding sensor protein